MAACGPEDLVTAHTLDQLLVALVLLRRQEL